MEIDDNKEIKLGESLKIYQGNAITDARYDMSVLEKQLIYLLLSGIKKKEREEGVLSYRIKIKDLGEAAQKTITNYSILREATKKLVSRVYEIWQKNESGRKVLVQTALLSSAEYVEGSGAIEVSISPKIKPYLMDLAKGFTVYSLDYAISLKSTYSQRIYELLSRYRNLGAWRVKVDDLKHMLKIENKYKGYGMFKKKVLEVAMKELREKTDVGFQLEERKTGRKVTELIFIIDQKDIGQSMEIEFDDKSKIRNKLKNEYKLANWQAIELSNKYPIAEIHKKLYEIKIMIVDGKVSNVGAYTWKIFQNLEKGRK